MRSSAWVRRSNKREYILQEYILQEYILQDIILNPCNALLYMEVGHRSLKMYLAPDPEEEQEEMEHNEEQD